MSEATGLTDPRSLFEELAGWAMGRLAGDEFLMAQLHGEDSDFVRFNGAAVRQAGSVSQRSMALDLVEGSRHAAGRVSITGRVDIDRARLGDLIVELRERRRAMPADPHLLYATGEASSERDLAGDLPAPAEALDQILTAAGGDDLVGVYAAGRSYAGFAGSTGQRNWHSSTTFNLDWSLHNSEGRATKNLYAGSAWDHPTLATKMDWAARELAVLDREPLELAPSSYRVYLAPAAVQDLVDMLAWGGFGLRSHRTRQTPLLRMVTDGLTFHPDVTMIEDVGGGVAPDFQEQGFRRPDQVVLIDGGHYAGHLVSPRSAMEYGVAGNGASAGEAPVAFSLAPGSLPGDRVLPELGRGVYVGNLWYLNFSDRAACRTTGMTRFGTFWVEAGEIVAPVKALRFDDTAYNLLGDRLVGLSDSAETILDPSSYGSRSTASYRLPGILVEEMRFTL